MWGRIFRPRIFSLYMCLLVLQVYKGLDVATNKATDEETEGIPHHMMGTFDWDDECNVHQYKDQALKIVSFLCFFLPIYYGYIFFVKKN